MSDFVGVEVQGVESIITRLDQLHPVVADNGIDEANKFLLKYLKVYPAYRHVRYKTAYGGWFSERQRRYVMARIQEGTIRPGARNATMTLNQSWNIVGYGRASFIANTAPYAHYVIGEEDQAALPYRVGWRKPSIIAERHTKGIGTAFEEGVKKAIKLLGL
mgnify:CR=1 FL=1